MKVFIIESSSPFDEMNGISERKSLEQVCKMMGHQVVTFFAKSKKELNEICRYISSIDEIERDETVDEPICVHISSHGDENGVQFGKDYLEWETLVKSLKPIFKMNYNEDFFLAISACGTINQSVHSEIRKCYFMDNIKPPKYIFTINEKEVGWKDAILNWTILYHQIDDIKNGNRKEYQNLLNKIIDSGFGNLKYNRWDHKKEKYFYYPKVEVFQ